MPDVLTPGMRLEKLRRLKELRDMARGITSKPEYQPSLPSLTSEDFKPRLAVAEPLSTAVDVMKPSMAESDLTRAIAEKFPKAGTLGRFGIQLATEGVGAVFKGITGVAKKLHEGIATLPPAPIKGEKNPITIGHNIAENLARGVFGLGLSLPEFISSLGTTKPSETEQAIGQTMMDFAQDPVAQLEQNPEGFVMAFTLGRLASKSKVLRPSAKAQLEQVVEKAKKVLEDRKLTATSAKLEEISEPAEISPELPSLGSEMIKSKSANVTIQSALGDLERTVEKLGPIPPKVNKAGIPTEISPEGKIVTKPQKGVVGKEGMASEHQIVGTPYWRDADRVADALRLAKIPYEKIKLQSEQISGGAYYSVGVKNPADFVRAYDVLKKAGIIKGKVVIPDYYKALAQQPQKVAVGEAPKIKDYAIEFIKKKANEMSPDEFTSWYVQNAIFKNRGVAKFLQEKGIKTDNINDVWLALTNKAEFIKQPKPELGAKLEKELSGKQFYIKPPIGDFVAVPDAKSIKISNFEEFDFFVRKVGGDWQISEGRTGRLLTTSSEPRRTLKSAIDEAQYKLRITGKKAFREMLQQNEVGGLSPRYVKPEGGTTLPELPRDIAFLKKPKTLEQLKIERKKAEDTAYLLSNKYGGANPEAQKWWDKFNKLDEEIERRAKGGTTLYSGIPIDPVQISSLAKSTAKIAEQSIESASKTVKLTGLANKAFFFQALNRVKTPLAKTIISDLANVRRVEGRLRGESFNPIRELDKIKDRSPEDVNLGEILQGKADNPKLNPLAGKLRRVMDRLRTEAINAGIQVKTAKGEFRDIGYVKDYFGRMLKSEVSEQIWGDIKTAYNLAERISSDEISFEVFKREIYSEYLKGKTPSEIAKGRGTVKTRPLAVQATAKTLKVTAKEKQYMNITPEGVLDIIDEFENHPERLHQIIANESLGAVIEETIKAGQVSEATKQAVKYFQATNQVSSMGEMVRLLDDYSYNDLYRPFGNIERARSLKFPAEFYETSARRVTTRYIMGTTRRIAEAQQWGPRNEVLFKKTRELAKQNPAEADLTHRIIDTFTGRLDRKLAPQTEIAKQLQEFVYGPVTSFEVGTKIGLGTATLVQATQPGISFIMEHGLYRALKGGLTLFNKANREFIRESGAPHFNVVEMMTGQHRLKGLFSGFASKTLKPFTLANQGLQYLAAGDALVVIKDWYRVVMKDTPDFRKPLYTANLKKVGIDPLQPLTEAKLKEGMFELANNSQLQRNILKEPLIWNDPRFRWLFLFKRFGLKQVLYTREVVWHNLKFGNPLPILRLVVAGYLGGELILEAKDKLRELLTGRKTIRSEEQFWQKVVNRLAAVGAIGVITDLARTDEATTVGALKDIMQNIAFFATPVQLSDAINIWVTGKQFAGDIKSRGVGQATGRLGANIVGKFGGALPRWVMERIRPSTQSLAAGEYMKTKAMTRFYDYYNAGDYESAFAVMQKWNETFPEDPIELKPSGIKQSVRTRSLLKAGIK